MILTMDYFPGDYVTMKQQYLTPKFKAGQIYRVTKFMQKNVRVLNVDTQTSVTGSPGCFEKVTDPVLIAAAQNRIKQVPTKRWVLGEVCTLSLDTLSRISQKPGRGVYPTTKFVVIKTSGDQVNVAKLGGDANRYWRFNPSALVPASAD